MSEARGAIALPLPSRAQQHPLRGTRPVEAGTRRLEDACAAVEGLFLSQLLSELEKPAFGGGILGTGVAHQLFSAQRNAAMGAELGRRDELGLAQMLRAQLLQAMTEAPPGGNDGSPIDGPTSGSGR